MPLPTPPSKLGSLLPPDEYKVKARPAKTAKRAAEGDTASAAAADYASTSVAEPMAAAANTPAALHAVDSAPAPARSRKSRQTAALLTPVPTPAAAPTAPA
ncbi:PhoH family protein, partial [Burkholderia gladioli]|nr:PhoH family protein [Burkholderia gladioli]MDN7923419.1 PhoH family protein [Burkholderia gladioli]